MNKKGCSFLEKGINFDLDTVCDCCISHNDGRGLPVLLKNYHGEPIDWEALFDIKAKRIEQQKKETIYDCIGCYHLSDYEFTNTRKISEFHFSHSRACNAKCVYCSDLYSAGTKNYDTYPIIKDLIEKGYYESGGEATLQGGEPTIMYNFDKLVDLFITHGTIIRVHTSGIRYSEVVANALEQDKGSVVISIDSGSSETYKKIKQVDAFESVCKTIEMYSKAAKNKESVILKYVLVPGYNDNIKEIDKFFALVHKLQISTVAFDIEVQYAKTYDNADVSPHVYLLYDYFKFWAEKFKIKLLTYSFFSYVLQNRKIKPLKINKISFINNFIIKKNEIKRKNLEYKR